MSLPDTVNAGFEVLGACINWMNVWQLHRDKSVRGVHWIVFSFLFIWTLWNLFYYPHLDQWASFCGGMFISVSQVAWLWLWFKYRNN